MQRAEAPQRCSCRRGKPKRPLRPVDALHGQTPRRAIGTRLETPVVYVAHLFRGGMTPHGIKLLVLVRLRA